MPNLWVRSTGIYLTNHLVTLMRQVVRYIYHDDVMTWRCFPHITSPLWGESIVFPISLALCEGNPLVTSGFPTQRASIVFSYWSEQTVERTFKVPWFETAWHWCVYAVIGYWWIVHYSDVILSVMASQIMGISIVYSTVCSAQIKENIKAPHHWPLCGEFTGDRWIPHTKGQ